LPSFAELRPHDTGAPQVVISAIHGNGGDVLKLIGDGTLAIFTAAAAEQACRGAIAAYGSVQERVAQLNQRRARAGLAVAQVYVALQIGEVFYGNIGSDERLDFTVVGPAVNEVARIAAMCRSVERDVVLSQAFADAMGADRHRTDDVEVGRRDLGSLSSRLLRRLPVEEAPNRGPT
jgi:adenylate cyclase